MTLLLALALLTQQAAPLIHIDSTTVIRRFDPRTAFGAGIDGHDRGEVERMLSPENAVAMKSMGLRSLTYRLRTELAGEVWHWNPEGTWSDPSREQGYWTSSATSRAPLLLTYGYRLPRRGDSLDQANRDDYSRLDDGDATTFWKSNPYLDPVYTGVSYEKSPQLIVLDFKKPHNFNEIHFNWAEPFPTRYRVEYASDEEDERPWNIATPIKVMRPHPGEDREAYAPFRARFVKIVLLASSGKAPAGSRDSRDGLGFAVNEISAGFTGVDGGFHDYVEHTKRNSTQTTVYVSSTDPWHRATDLDKHTEQPGFDLILARRLDQGQSILVPTGCLYNTPQNAANEVKWLTHRRVKLRGIEIGEEPDGNWAEADHYAQLYMQMAHAIREVLPQARLGGPSFQSASGDYQEWPHSGEPWLTRFKQTLGERGRLSDFRFCSFEWYPFDDVRANPAPRLVKAPRLLASSVERLQGLGMAKMPWYITEFGWSAFAGPVEVRVPSGIFDLEVALLALSMGCETSFQYGYEPNEPNEEAPGSWGNIMALLTTGGGSERLPTYWSAWLLTHRLCAAAGQHSLLRTVGGDATLGAYAVQGPSGTINLALLNRAPNGRQVSVQSRAAVLKGWSYGEPQFSWTDVSANTVPERNLPPADVKFKAQAVELAPYSITILGM